MKFNEEDLAALLKERQKGLAKAKEYFKEQLNFHPESLEESERDFFSKMLEIIDTISNKQPNKNNVVSPGDTVLIQVQRHIVENGKIMDNFIDIVFAYDDNTYPKTLFLDYFDERLDALTLPYASMICNQKLLQKIIEHEHEYRMGAPETLLEVTALRFM